MAHSAGTWSLERSIPSESGAHSPIVDEILDRLERERWSSHDVFGVRLSLEEALVNAIKHGNRLDRRKQVRVTCQVGPDRVWVRIADEGRGFQPEMVPDPTDPANLENPNGRGIMLMRSYMTRVEFNASGNVVEMEKNRQPSAEAV